MGICIGKYELDRIWFSLLVAAVEVELGGGGVGSIVAIRAIGKSKPIVFGSCVLKCLNTKSSHFTSFFVTINLLHGSQL